MEIRPYLETDEQAVIELWRASFGYSAPHNEPALAIRRKLACQRELFFVANSDGRVVGTILGGYDGHRGWIYSLAVDATYRRRGIGSALLRHMERILAGMDCPKINLQVMNTNPQVVEFYRQHGYCIEERISMAKIVDLSTTK